MSALNSISLVFIMTLTVGCDKDPPGPELVTGNAERPESSTPIDDNPKRLHVAIADAWGGIPPRERRLDSLVANIAKLAKREAQTLHVFLWRASNLARDSLRTRTWSETVTSLVMHECSIRLNEGWDLGDRQLLILNVSNVSIHCQLDFKYDVTIGIERVGSAVSNASIGCVWRGQRDYIEVSRRVDKSMSLLQCINTPLAAATAKIYSQIVGIEFAWEHDRDPGDGVLSSIWLANRRSDGALLGKEVRQCATSQLAERKASNDRNARTRDEVNGFIPAKHPLADFSRNADK